LSLRRGGAGEILPDYDAVIFDEAHQLEDTAGPTFGIELSDLKIFDLARDLLKEGKRGGKTPPGQAMMRVSQQLEVLGRLLSKDLAQGRAKTGRFPLDHQKVDPGFLDTCGKIVHAAREISAIITPGSDNPSAWEPLYRRGIELAHCAQSILDGKDPSLVYWYELTPNATFLHGTPIEVGPLLRDHLFGRVPTVVLTSATLSVAGSFDYVRNSLGAPAACAELALQSPFDYGSQAGLFIPARFPAPPDPDFSSSLAAQAIEILGKTHGRALLLFTSYRNMTAVHELIKGKLPYPILMQGQKAKRALLAEFKENVSSVLLATSSFWQGIDVPGETLSCLLIDKLPFEAPDDPLIAARMAKLNERGKSPFFHYQVPRAIIGLRQGVGRLIRSPADRGIIGIFDIRLTTKGYGRLFLTSLPPCRTISHLDEIDDFMAEESR
jgi:ATP-dependent DNA helicase DinG